MYQMESTNQKLGATNQSLIGNNIPTGLSTRDTQNYQAQKEKEGQRKLKKRPERYIYTRPDTQTRTNNEKQENAVAVVE